ncbi:tRNA ligase 1 isoform X5 [Elaeis guineensis]|uniref:tRNA ligase 1 isoform X5 n=1 Tax=Elaeis guineensis var. tenera TaxID=51953 RepID=UPI003C6D3A93
MEVAAAETDRNSLAVEKENSGVGGLTKLFKGPQGEDFNVDNNTFSKAQIRATFYAKFENEKSDQEVGTRMIEMVSHGQATWEE